MNKFLTLEEQESVKKVVNPADYVLRQMAMHVRGIKQSGVADIHLVVALTDEIAVLGEVQGACERLAATPVPFAYTLLVHRTVYLYIILAPFALT